MCDHCGCRSFAPIAELTADHELLERAAFDRRSYFPLAAHIEEEEIELFSVARSAFGDEEWEEMAQAHHADAHQFGVAHTHDGPAAQVR